MRVAVCLLFCISCLLNVTILAQQSTAHPAQAETSAVTVPLVLDHNRIVIEVDVSLSGAPPQRVHAWVDNGNPEFWMSQRVAGLIGLDVNCVGPACTGKAKTGAALGELSIHGLKLSLVAMSGVRVLPGAMAPGMNAEIHIPSAILRDYDVLVDFPGRKFNIGPRGSLKFNGTKTKAVVDPATGLIRISSQIENKKYDLGLDLGASMSSLSKELFEKLSAAHPEWPKMIGAVGPANMTGSSGELKQRLMRVDRLQFGPAFLVDVAVADSGDRISDQGRAGDAAGSGSLGVEALLNYRIGLDYAHSAVYFEIGRTFNFPDFDVIGLTLRPEADGKFAVAAIADFHGEPSVLSGADGVQSGDLLLAVDDIPTAGSTLGQVWAMLGGEIGQQRRLTLERDGKRFVLLAKVQHFIGTSVLR
jgi:hypothetical protein